MTCAQLGPAECDTWDAKERKRFGKGTYGKEEKGIGERGGRL